MAGLGQSLRVLLRSLGAQETTPWLGYKRAERRGDQLLINNLSPAQREQYGRLGYFEVIGCDTGTRYRIRYGYQLNVEQLDRNGRRLRTLCFLPVGGVPVGDVMLAQKIALEVFESEAIEVAKWSPAVDYFLEGRLLTRRGRHRRS